MSVYGVIVIGIKRPSTHTQAHSKSEESKRNWKSVNQIWQVNDEMRRERKTKLNLIMSTNA